MQRPSIQQAEQSVKKVKVELESDPTVLQRGKEENYATATVCLLLKQFFLLLTL